MTNSRIIGLNVSALTKEQVANWVADAFGLPHPYTSNGGSVDSRFLKGVLTRLGSDDDFPNGYRRLERCLHLVGQPYDPRIDSSESRGHDGGGTVTREAFLKLMSGYLDTPRSFILKGFPRPQSGFDRTMRVETLPERATRALRNAGAGARILFEEDAKISSMARLVRARAISDSTSGLEFDRLTMFDRSVNSSDLDMENWPATSRLTEVSSATFERLVDGNASSPYPFRPRSFPSPSSLSPITEELFDRLSKFDRPRIASFSQPLPEVSPPITVDGPSTEALLNIKFNGAGSNRDREPGLDKQTELRAVALVTEYLRQADWHVVRDMQQLGVGFDLLVQRDRSFLKVEVKGIRGANLVFNMTPKEWSMLENDPDFVLIAVTKVLNDKLFTIHVLDRTHFIDASRAANSYRVSIAVNRP